MGLLSGDIDITDAQVRVSMQQVIEDFDAGTAAFSLHSTPQEKQRDLKMFCLGVTMTMLTLKGYSEDPSVRPRRMTMEQAIESYYEAARRKLHAD